MGTRLRPNWIPGPAPNSRPVPILGPPQKGVARWWRLKWEIYLQNDHFGLVYDILGLDAKNYKFGNWFANNVIHLGPQMMLIIDREKPLEFTRAISLCHNFVYISTLENQEDTSLNQNFQINVLSSHANSGKVVKGLDCTAGLTNQCSTCMVFTLFAWNIQLLAHSLNHWGRVMHICISKLTIIVTDKGLSHGRRQAIIRLNQCWNIVSWTLWNKLYWNLIQNLCIFIQEKASETVFTKIIGQWTCRTFPMARFKCLMRDFTNLNRLL